MLFMNEMAKFDECVYDAHDQMRNINEENYYKLLFFAIKNTNF